MNAIGGLVSVSRHGGAIHAAEVSRRRIPLRSRRRRAATADAVDVQGRAGFRWGFAVCCGVATQADFDAGQGAVSGMLHLYRQSVAHQQRTGQREGIAGDALSAWGDREARRARLFAARWRAVSAFAAAASARGRHVGCARGVAHVGNSAVLSARASGSTVGVAAVVVAAEWGAIRLVVLGRATLCRAGDLPLSATERLRRSPPPA